ncbi:MAG: ACT domain-containing protein [Planctomycetes bacterium]|nr:ACT domain-containing protein [Planctomycetota bacterium]
MAYEISKVDVWAGSIEDRPGGLADKLEVLAKAGASLEFLIARRDTEQPGTGVVFLAPLRGVRQTRAAQDAGLAKAGSMFSLRLEGPDKPGLGARISRLLAEAGINLRGLSAAAFGRKSVVYFSFDSLDDAAKATRILKKALAGK